MGSTAGKPSGKKEPTPGEAKDVSDWNLALVVAAVSALFVVLFVAYSALDVPKLSPACDRPEDAAGVSVCQSSSRSSTKMSAPFVRVTSPHVERFAWRTASAALVTVVLVLLVPSYRWWRELREDLGPERGARSNWLVPVALALLVAGLVVPTRVSRFNWLLILTAIPTLISWFAAVPAMATVLDVHATASLGHPQLQEAQTTGVVTAKRLREYLRRSVAILGLQIAAWVVWYGAAVRLTDALAAAGLARQGGTYSVTPDGSISVIVYGAVLTALLAFAFVVASSALDRRARGIADILINRDQRQADSEEARKLRAVYYEEMGVERSQRSRFEGSVAISAPLLGALFSQFVT